MTAPERRAKVAEDSLVLCKTCEELRPSDDFYVQQRDGRTYVHKTCKRCNRRRSNEQAWRVVRRPGRLRSKLPARLTEQGMSGEERRAYWSTFKMRQGCADCGATDWRILEFDHLPEFEKLFTIGEAIRQTGYYTDEQIAAEVAKCEVVCHDCHMIRTADRHTAAQEGICGVPFGDGYACDLPKGHA